jgi:hypothetical protein
MLISVFPWEITTEGTHEDMGGERKMKIKKRIVRGC